MDGTIRQAGAFVKYSAPVIALLYAAAGILWILLSDRAVEYWFGDTADTYVFHTLKGIGYILVSAVLLWLLVQRAINHIEHARRLAAESEERFRLMANNVADVFWLIDYQTQQLIYISPAFDVMWGRAMGGRIPTPEEFAAWIHPEDRDRIFQTFATLLEHAGSQSDLEYRIVLPDGSVRWLQDRPRPVNGAKGEQRYITGVTRDVTRQKESERAAAEAAETERRLLLELDHRVRNALAGLMSMVELSSGTYTSVEAFAAAVARRVKCMSDVNQLLSESRWVSIDLHRLIGVVVPPEMHRRLDANGPPVSIPPRQATALAMILQEFTSNALKHGALAEVDGRIRVGWSIEPATAGGGSVLHVIWTEEPLVGEPRAFEPGLGTRLIRGFARSELRGQVKLACHEHGVRHELIATLDEPRTNASDAVAAG